MPLRPFALPDDIPILAELIPQAFQYPENDAWSLQSDEVESFIASLRGIRRMWPLLRLSLWLSPALADALRGFVWEEEGRVVGLANVMRQGLSAHWYIANVAVLPGYRRRGIARQLVEACVGLARAHGAARITLDVVAGNSPAYTLYERLGFEHFTGKAELVYERADPPPAAPLPQGYRVARVSPDDWRSAYDLARRITPAAVTRFDPVEAQRFREQGMVSALAPLLRLVTGSRSEAFILHAPGGAVVAHTVYSTRTRQGGRSLIRISLDPAHADPAAFLVRATLRGVLDAGPGRRVNFSVAHWQPALLAAAEDAGFARPYDQHTLGLLLSDTS